MFKKMTEKKLEKILTMYEDDKMSMAQIAKALKLGTTTIRYHLVKMKVKLRARSQYFDGSLK